jgi:hypothetical protein
MKSVDVQKYGEIQEVGGKTYLFGNIEVGVDQLISTLVNGVSSGDLGGKLANLLFPGNDTNYFRRNFGIPWLDCSREK